MCVPASRTVQYWVSIILYTPFNPRFVLSCCWLWRWWWSSRLMTVDADGGGWMDYVVEELGTCCQFRSVSGVGCKLICSDVFMLKIVWSEDDFDR